MTKYPVFRYWILFETRATSSDYAAVVVRRPGAGGGTPPLLEFDEEIVPVLGGIRYALRLPRSPADTVDLDPIGCNVLRQIESPHRILLMPWMPGILDYAELAKHAPVLVLAPERVATPVETHLRGLDVQAPVRRVEHLDDATLRDDWRQIALGCVLPGRRLLSPPGFPTSPSPCALSQGFLERQVVPARTPSPPSANEFLHISAIAQAAGVLARRGENEPTLEAFGQVVLAEASKLTIPVVWGAPAHSPAQLRMGRPDTDAHRDIERLVFELLVNHRAVARTGFALQSERASDSIFATLDAIERHFEARRPRGRVIWRLLNRLGGQMASLLTEEEKSFVRSARDVTVFSSLPLGLARLPGEESPMCCARNVSYQPVAPLTRALQVELMGEPVYVVPRPARILLAECLPRSDRLYRASQGGWSVLLEVARQDGLFAVDVIHAEVEADLARALEDDRYSFLILSGHGYYDRGANIAGLMIGHEPSMLQSLRSVPPVVILSACHVAPRARGAVSVADLLLRVGATCVLGTLVPVDVRKNALLMTRFLLYVAEAVKGENDHRTLADVWSSTTTTNAINEILHEARQIIHRETRLEPEETVTTEFMFRRSRGRLRASHIYSDTIAVLREMMSERGETHLIEPILASRDFVPESLLYMFLGAPERIRFREPTEDEL